MSRKKEREYALKGVFQLDFHTEPEDFKDSINYFIEDSEINIQYGKALINTTEKNIVEIDGILNEYLKSTWKIDRIPKIEKSILRLAICELEFMTDKPPYEVVINEAIELTKKYGDEDGKNYVNGILNKIVKDRLIECS
jgi:N utilization substance protein B